MIKFGDSVIEILSDGTFTLEVGACFGVVPKKIWSRSVTESENNRVAMAVNIPLIRTGSRNILIDSGVGRAPDERMARIYEINKTSDILDQVEERVGKNGIDKIVHSHLHFDHMGHSFERFRGEVSFPSAVRIAQEEEFNNMENPNEVTRGSYLKNAMEGDSFNISKVNGNVDLKDGLRVVRTGGHTSGHQAVIYEKEGKGLIYFGDILPSVFNLKLPYITAIDTYPLETLEMKKKLLTMAMEKNYICIFNHDLRVPAAYLHGSLENIEYEPAEI